MNNSCDPLLVSVIALYGYIPKIYHGKYLVFVELKALVRVVVNLVLIK